MTKRLIYFLIFSAIISLGYTSDDDLFFIGKWQSLNDYSALIEFTKEKKIILFKNEESFWVQATKYGELNYEISKQSDDWYKLVTLDGTDEFYKGRIEIVDKNRIRIYFHKHHDILDVADEYYRTDGFNNLSKIMKKILKTPDNK
jgi:hypothetical protein